MQTTYPNRTFKVFDLQLGDHFKLFDGEYGTAIVTKIEGNEVSYFRPYGTTADFSYTGGVIPYIGVEQNTLWRNSSQEYYVYRRQDLK